MINIKILACDTEGALIPNHQPYNNGFYVSVICLIPSWENDPVFIWVDHETHLPTPNGINIIKEYVSKCDIFAAQNLKHDLNILRYLGVNFDDVKLHCTMVTDYLLNGQSAELAFNLNDICTRRGFPLKLDVVKTNYWEKKIETYNVPAPLLEEYCLDDTQKVLDITKQQLQEIDPIRKVYDIQMEFILSLSDMEMNGFLWDNNKSTQIIQDYKFLYDKHINRILEIVGDDRVNINSGDQLSAILYGGIIKIQVPEWTIKECKTQPYSYYYEKIYTEEKEIAGLGFIPLPNTELKKQGYYSTDKSTISRLVCKTKEQKEVKSILLELSKISKILETLSGKTDDTGLINKVQLDGRIHPNLNQAVTKTGRLSSSNPNGQNLPRGNTSPIKQCIISEY